MNKAYKVIWSKVRNCYMVVSELAKRNGKCSSALNKKILASFLAAGLVAVAPASVQAEVLNPFSLGDKGNTRQITGVAPGTTDTDAVNYAQLKAASGLTTDNRVVGLTVNKDGVREITSPFIQISGIAEATDDVTKTGYAQANWASSIAVGAYASTGGLPTLAEAEVGAYYNWQQIIKNDSNLVNEVAVQNATNYASLRNALTAVKNNTTNSDAIRNAATTYLNQLNNTVSTLLTRRVDSTNSIAMGNNATVMGKSAIAMGDGAAAMNPYFKTPADYAIAIGNKATAANTDTIAIGKSNESFSQYGLSSPITSGAWGTDDIAIGTDAAAHGERVSAITGTILDGGGYFTEGGKGKAIAIGYRSQALREYTVAVGEQAMATGENSLAMGHGARALTPGSIAIGGTGNGTAGVQQGTLNTAKDTTDKGGYSITIGRANNFTTGYDANDNYFANTKNSIAIGNMAHTHAANAFAIGVSTDATAERSFAIGTSSTNFTGSHQGSRAAGQGSITFGDTATVFTVFKDLNIPSGDYGRATNTMVNDAIAVGTNSLSQARNAVALGGGMSYTYHDISSDGKTMTNITKYFNGSSWVDRAEGTGANIGEGADGAVAIGGATGDVDEGANSSYFPTSAPGSVTNYTAAARATVAKAVALGTGSVANREAMNPNPLNPSLRPSYATSGYDVTTGKAYSGSGYDSSTWMSTLAAVSIGEETGLYKDENGNLIANVINTRQITGVAAGSADTDAVNVAQLKRVAERIAPAITIKAGDNITIDEITNAAGSIEYTIHAQGFGGTGTGSNISSDNRAVTLTPNKDTDEKSITSPYLHINGLDKAPTADYAKADGTDSIAIGRSATVTEIAPRGVAIGNRAMVNNKDAVALGSNASATNHFSVALGPNAEASIHTSVALGSHSVTTAEDKAGIRTGKYGYDVVTNSQYKGVDRFSPTWQSTAGSVSVGGGVEPATGDTVTRRISNVAAGIKDTDVVNVAQLKRATNYLTDHRSTSIGTNANGEREIVSPYLAMHGVKEAAQAQSLLNTYGTYKDYTDALQKDISTLKGEKASLNRDVTNLTKEISDLDARMAAINDKKSEAYKDLANERAILNEEKTTLSKELNEVTEMLAEREGLLKTADVDYEKAKELASDHAYVDGEKSFAQGSGTKVVGKESMAQGSGSTVIGDQSMAIGTGHEVYGSNSGAIGDPNVVAADESYAIGNNNNIGGVTKDKADIKTKNIFVYGNSNKIEAGKSHVYVLGSNVTTVESNSVILGNESAVYAEANNRTAGTGAYKSETINGKTYNYAGGDNEVGVVSVGNADAPRRIQNVAPGKVSAESTDAINGSQLYSAIENVNTNLGDQISNVDSRANKGIAGAAALAALHPLDFDPDDKLQFSAGMGHYRGKTAAAVGLFYRPDEKVMFNIGGTMGNGENLINAGITFSLDRTPRVTGSRTALTKEVVHLREHVARQDAQLALQDQQLAMQGAQIAQLTALVSQLTGKKVELPTIPQQITTPALFPDNLDNKWAYDKLEELEQQGYIRGYAGRTLSRDEFAAALDRALAGGATLEERLVKEFEPELSHVRVAHVEGKGNEEGEWYERPRTSYDKLEKHEIARKPFRVQKKEK